MGELATRTKRTIDVQLKAAQQQSKCIQLIQMYQQQLQQLQQQAFGQPSPLQLGAAYRVPDTSINLSGQYQNGARARASASETRAPPAPPPPARPGALSGYISSRAPDSERRAPFPLPRPALSLSPPRGASPSLAGKTSLQLTCVPDDSAAMLGPNGFTRGVGPGNLGLSVTVNI